MSALENRFPFLDRNARYGEKCLDQFHRVLMNSPCVAGSLDFECLVVFAHSCVDSRLWARELIGFTDNSRFVSQIQIRGCDSVFSQSFVTGLRFSKLGKYWEN